MVMETAVALGNHKRLTYSNTLPIVNATMGHHGLAKSIRRVPAIGVET